MPKKDENQSTLAHLDPCETSRGSIAGQTEKFYKCSLAHKSPKPRRLSSVITECLDSHERCTGLYTDASELYTLECCCYCHTWSDLKYGTTTTVPDCDNKSNGDSSGCSNTPSYDGESSTDKASEEKHEHIGGHTNDPPNQNAILPRITRTTLCRETAIERRLY